jgi:broad specificity phosphatase PhoE
VTILLLRHAHAADRDRWLDRDRARPLSEHGVRQAAALVERYAGRAVERIISSPFARCLASVAPLAAVHHLDVEEDDALAEGAPLDVVQRLIRQVDGTPTLLCSHGDVIGALVTDLSRHDVDVVGDLRWPTGSTWVLEEPPNVSRAVYLSPPL